MVKRCDRTVVINGNTSHLSVDLINELIEYDKDDGSFTWRRRSIDYFPCERTCNGWNSRYAGEKAGCIAKTKNNSYRKITLFKKMFHASDLALLLSTGEWPNGVVVHVDGDTTNDALRNLKVVEYREAYTSNKVYKNNTTGHKGIYASGNGFFTVQVSYHGKQYHVMRTNDIDEAILARKKAEKDFGYRYLKG